MNSDGFVPLDDEEVHSCWPLDGPLGKLCQCNSCGIVRRCDPSFDFYKRPEDPEEHLFCGNCIVKFIFGDDIVDPERVITIEMDEMPQPGDTIEIEGEEDDEGEPKDPADWWKK